MMNSPIPLKGKIRMVGWKILEDRYPATTLWWGGLGSPATLWPTWTPAGFQKEMASWLQLAEMTVRHPDVEVQSWGRYARFSVGRISGAHWRRPVAVLRHAKTMLWTAWMLDPAGQTIFSARLFKEALIWLEESKRYVQFNSWERIECQSEIDQLRSWIHSIPRPPDMGRIHWEAWQEKFYGFLDRFRDEVLSARPNSGLQTPWISSVHVNAGGYRRRRKDRENVTGDHAPNMPESEYWSDSFPAGHNGRAPSLVLVPQLRKDSWVRWNLKQKTKTIYYGDMAQEALGLSNLLHWWFNRSQVDGLTWILSTPPQWEARLLLLANATREMEFQWGQERTTILRNFVRRYEVMALIDEWLWLENGDPSQVVEWVSRVSTEAFAYFWVPRIKNNPGRFVMTDILYHDLDKRMREAQTSAWYWDNWQWGPMDQGLTAWD